MSRIDDIPRWKKLYKAAQKADDRFQAALVKEYGSRAGDMRYRNEKQTPAIRKLGAAYRKKSIELSKMNEYYRTHTENPKRSRNTGTTVPAHVRINPRTGRIQVFVTPKVAEKLRGGKGLRVAGATNKRNPVKQYEVKIPPGRLGSYRLGYVASNAADAKRRALADYNRSLSNEGFPTVKSLPRGTKVIVH